MSSLLRQQALESDPAEDALLQYNNEVIVMNNEDGLEVSRTNSTEFSTAH